MNKDDRGRIRQEFDRAVNMTAKDISDWLQTAQSASVGFLRAGETESVGRQSARKIIAILKTPATDLTDADYAHMRKTLGFIRRHLAQRPARDVTHTRWRYSLMNWGHDPAARDLPLGD